MNRYVIFAGSNTPSGGFDDFVADFKELQYAFKFIDTIHYVGINKEPAEWVQIVDLDRKDILVEMTREHEFTDKEIIWKEWKETHEIS